MRQNAHMLIVSFSNRHTWRYGNFLLFKLYEDSSGFHSQL